MKLRITPQQYDECLINFLKSLEISQKYKEMNISDLKLWFYNQTVKLIKGEKQANDKTMYKGFKVLTIDEKNNVGVETKPMFIWTDNTMKNYSMVRTDKEGKEYFTKNGERVFL